MLITLETTTGGQKRVYCTRTNSIITYFTDDGEGGAMLTAEHGEFSLSSAWADERLQAVKASVLQEVARRLACDPGEVEEHSFAEVAAICDPDPETLKPRIKRRAPGRTKATMPFVR